MALAEIMPALGTKIIFACATFTVSR